MFKATLYLKTLKRIVTISTDVLYCTSRSNFSSVNPSVCSSSSLLGYAVSGEVFNNDKGVCRNFRNLNHDKCNFLRIQRRSFSLQSSFDSIVQTYARLFQLLSESTVVGHAQNTIITIHDMTGLPWWASIMLTTVLMRSLVTLPLSLYQNYVAAKLANVSVELKEIAKELSRETTIAARQFYWSETQAKIMFRRSMKKQWTKLIERDNCHPAKASLLIWFQIPMWIIFSFALRNIVNGYPPNDIAVYITYLEFCTGGFLWMPNLTVPDSFVLPVILGLTNLMIVEIQSMMSTQEKRSRLQVYAINFFRCFSLFMIPLAAVVPSCLSLYWTTSSVYGLFQNLILMSPKVKRLARIPRSPNTLDHPYKHLAEKIKKRFT